VRFSQRPFPAVRLRKVVSILILVIGELEQPLLKPVPVAFRPGPWTYATGSPTAGVFYAPEPHVTVPSQTLARNIGRQQRLLRQDQGKVWRVQRDKERKTASDDVRWFRTKRLSRTAICSCSPMKTSSLIAIPIYLRGRRGRNQREVTLLYLHGATYLLPAIKSDSLTDT
jgi:hypothetical protein